MISRSKIEAILRTADIEGFIESGAPDDEYDSEAEDIAVALEKLTPEDLTEDNVLVLVADVWAESFGHDEDVMEKIRPYLKEIARLILA